MANRCKWKGGEGKVRPWCGWALRPQGDLLAYPVLKGNKWFLVVGDEKSEAFDYVWRPVFSSDGTKVAYGAMKGCDVWWKVMDVKGGCRIISPPIGGDEPIPSKPAALQEREVTHASPVHPWIAMVNLKDCFDGKMFQRVADLEATFKAFTDEFEERLKEAQKRVKTLRDEISVLVKGDPLREKKATELALAQARCDIERESAKKQWLTQYAAVRVEIYNEIRHVVDLVAMEEKFYLIIKTDAPWLDPEEPQSVAERVGHRAILSSDSEIDITPLVLKRLNEEYIRQKENNRWKPK